MARDNNEWNSWKLQSHWYQLEWVDPESIYKRNPLNVSPKRFERKDDISEFHFVGHSMLKPIDYKALFDNKITSEELEVDVSTTETGDTY